jgi:hypothetical protein
LIGTKWLTAISTTNSAMAMPRLQPIFSIGSSGPMGNVPLRSEREFDANVSLTS